MSLDALKDFFGEGNEPMPEQEEPEPTDLILTGQIEREKKRHKLYKEMAENIRNSEALRHKINHGVKQEEDIFILLTDSLKCISLMTGDKLFYKRNIETLKKRFNQ